MKIYRLIIFIIIVCLSVFTYFVFPDNQFSNEPIAAIVDMAVYAIAYCVIWVVIEAMIRTVKKGRGAEYVCGWVLLLAIILIAYTYIGLLMYSMSSTTEEATVRVELDIPDTNIEIQVCQTNFLSHTGSICLEIRKKPFGSYKHYERMSFADECLLEDYDVEAENNGDGTFSVKTRLKDSLDGWTEHVFDIPQ